MANLAVSAQLITRVYIHNDRSIYKKKKKKRIAGVRETWCVLYEFPTVYKFKRKSIFSISSPINVFSERSEHMGACNRPIVRLSVCVRTCVCVCGWNRTLQQGSVEQPHVPMSLAGSCQAECVPPVDDCVLRSNPLRRKIVGDRWFILQYACCSEEPSLCGFRERSVHACLCTRMVV